MVLMDYYSKNSNDNLLLQNWSLVVSIVYWVRTMVTGGQDLEGNQLVLA